MENAYVLQLSDSKFKDLFLCFCGYAQCQPLHSFGPAVRPNYIIHFILDGKGVYQVGEKHYELHTGQGFLIEPDEQTFYQANDAEPWTYLWIGFDGVGAQEYVKELGLNNNHRTFHSEHGNELKRIVLKMLKNHQLTVTNQYLLQSLLYEFFYVLSKDLAVNDEKTENEENFYVRQAITFIRNHYSEGIKVADVAENVCVNRSYLYKMFQQNLQMSPQTFLSRFRISRATELLVTTNISIEDIASSCGYQNPVVFSKAFKKETGMPPTVYRTKHGQEVRQSLIDKETSIEQMLEEEDIF